ncbi:MAG: hypothetical protein AABY13_05955 [Nanoarchaeota archaeon]
MDWLLVISIIVSLVAILFFLGLVRSYMVQHGRTQKEFLKGTVPTPLPSGLYRGIFRGHATGWKGKYFDAKKSAGINIFRRGGKLVRVYPFHTYVDRGLRDHVRVIKIDYNIRTNPFWLRLVLDEIVQVRKGKFLGKLQLRIIPHIPFTLLYFRLEK